MSTPAPNRILAVLKLPEYEVPRLIVLARAMVEAMASHPVTFPSPDPPLSAVRTEINALADAEATTYSRLVGSVAARNARRALLVASLQRLRMYVQVQADAANEYAGALIESAGMWVKRPRRLPPRVFAAKPGRTSGCVVLIAPKAGHRAGYEWAQSNDGGETWTSLEFTVKASKTVVGLRPGKTVHFRYRASTKDGTGDWSQLVSIIVD